MEISSKLSASTALIKPAKANKVAVSTAMDKAISALLTAISANKRDIKALKELGIKRNAVKVLIYRARNKLRHALKQGDEEQENK